MNPHETAKIAAIKRHFQDLEWFKLIGYETAELRMENGKWEPWPDLPIRLFWNSDDISSVAWEDANNLWLKPGKKLPGYASGLKLRWKQDTNPEFEDAIFQRLRGALLGRGQMSYGGEEIEIWTRLVLELGDFWLEIYNALDQNGYKLHRTLPDGEFIRCF